MASREGPISSTGEAMQEVLICYQLAAKQPQITLVNGRNWHLRLVALMVQHNMTRCMSLAVSRPLNSGFNTYFDQ